MILKNDFIKATFKTYGGELTSLYSVKEDFNYLWTGDEAYWPGQAPTLFPIVGKVKSQVMNQHGFARRMEHSLVNETPNSLTFSVSYTEDTLKVYPYKFELLTTYSINKNMLTVSYKVKNLDDKPIYFSIGAHPGFNIPLCEGESFEDYYIEFNSKETAPIYPIDLSLGLIINEPQDFLKDENRIELSRDLFRNDALIFKNLKSNSVSIKSNKCSRHVTMDFTGFPWFAIWSKPTGAPFVCLEPWYGHADFKDFDGEFFEKDGIEMLPVSSEFNCSFTISI